MYKLSMQLNVVVCIFFLFPECERNLETTNKQLQLNVTKLKEKLDEMASQQQEGEKSNDAMQEICQTKVTGMKAFLNSSKGRNLLAEDKMIGTRLLL